jgi:hypothetical protein
MNAGAFAWSNFIAVVFQYDDPQLQMTATRTQEKQKKTLSTNRQKIIRSQPATSAILFLRLSLRQHARAGDAQPARESGNLIRFGENYLNQNSNPATKVFREFASTAETRKPKFLRRNPAFPLKFGVHRAAYLRRLVKA